MIRTINLATYYLLPLIELSKSSFGDAGSINLKTKELVITDKSNFINCYLSTENYIVVMVKHLNRVPDESLSTHNYFSDIEVEDAIHGKVTLILYRVDKSYLVDLTTFREGKYSRMREVAKNRIVIFNGWESKVHKENQPLYGVLYRDPRLRQQIEDDFQVSLSPEDEVKALPDEGNFIDLSQTFKEVQQIPA
jgi:hypothetical protein